MQYAPKILIKYPSRGRKERFFCSLDSAYNNIQDIDNVHISCTLDDDDDVMNNRDVIQKISSYKNTSICWGKSKSKIDAVNRDMPSYGDIIIVHSDDMLFTLYGFDTIIRNEFLDGDYDKLIHIPDQDAKDMLATMYIAGRTFYERFNYVYHPSYKSLWCDNEVQEVSKILGKYKYLPFNGLISHLNPAYNHLPKDEMFIMQQKDWNDDESNFYERKKRNFDI